MRIKVSLPANAVVKLPINQNYFLSSAIYNIISARPDYAKFLHDTGYLHESSGRHFKLFVFSPLMCPDRRIAGEDLYLGPGEIEWFISSPMTEFVTALAEGLLSHGEIEVRGVHLPIRSVEALAEPVFTEQMDFTCMSPIVAARPAANGYAEFLTHEQPEAFSDHVRANLVRKYELIYNRPPSDDRFQMRFDKDYIKRKNGRVTKLIDIRGINIRGVLAPFCVEGSTELIRLGYYCGLGERGSMGFGCVEQDTRRKRY